MQCSSCRTQLPEEATYCPACGALTPYGVSKYRVAPYDPTAVSFPYDASLQAPPPATGYGSPPYGVPLQNPYEPLNPYAISLHPYTFPPPANPRGRLNKALLIASIAVVLVIVVGGVVGLSIMRSTTGVAPTPTPTTVPYPSMSSAYSGSVHNITYNQSANMVLTSVVQDADKINGDIRFGLPLVGSGSFTGTVSRQGAIQFLVTSGDMGGVTLTFSGSIATQGSLSGMYSVNNGQKGTWKAFPAVSPVVYPLLFPNYAGTFHNNSTSQNGPMSLAIITQDQQNFTGIFDNSTSVNGTFGDNNSIQFTATNSNGEPIAFTGTVNIDGSLSGTYIASSSVTGTWKVLPMQK